MLKVFKLGSFLVASLIGLSLIKAVEAKPSAKLTVIVDGLPNKNGEVCLGIFANEQGFPQSSKDVIQSSCVKVTGASVSTQFSGLQPGKYAVALFHDENGDKKFNKNVLGIPEEGFGISNNPPITIEPPTFETASFAVKGNTTIKIAMQYLSDR